MQQGPPAVCQRALYWGEIRLFADQYLVNSTFMLL